MLPFHRRVSDWPRTFISGLHRDRSQSHRPTVEMSANEDSIVLIHAPGDPQYGLADVDEQGIPPPSKRPRLEHECDICGLSYAERRTLVRHFKTPEHCRKAGLPAAGFPCPLCAKVFSRDDICRRHASEVHFNNKRRRPSSLPYNSSVPSGGTGRQTPLQEDASPSNTGVQSDHADGVARASVDNPALLSGGLRSDTSIGTPCCPSLLGSGVTTLSAAKTQLAHSPRPPGIARMSPSFLDGSHGASEGTHCSVSDKLGVGSAATRAEPGNRLRESLQLIRNRSSLIRNGASSRPCQLVHRPSCDLCRMPFGSTEQEVRAHLEKHFHDFSGEHLCNICDIGFVYADDLEWHLESAKRGTCGYRFAHDGPCTGHHSTDSAGVLSDRDRLRLCYGLRHWEQLRLRAYMWSVDAVLEGLQDKNGECWSVGEAAGRRSFFSLSTLFSRLEVESTPSHVNFAARLETSAVRARVADRLANRTWRDMLRAKQYLGVDQAALDALLSHAVKEGRVSEARSLLRAGADVDGRSSVCAATPLTMAIFRGHAAMVRLLAQRGASLNFLILLDEAEDNYTVKYLTRLGIAAETSPGVFRSNFFSGFTSTSGRFGMRGALDSKDGSFSLRTTRTNSGSREAIVANGINTEKDRRASGLVRGAMVIGDGDLDDNYYLPPSFVVDALDLKDVPAGVALWHAISHGHAAAIDAFCCHNELRDTASAMLLLAARHGQAEQFAALLQASEVVAQSVRNHSGILEAAALASNERTVDVLLKHVSTECIRSVLRGAIERNRKDVVVMLCTRTDVHKDLLYRWQHAGFVASPSIVRRQDELSATWNEQPIDTGAIYVLFATASPGQWYAIVESLVQQGVSEATIFEVLGRVSESQSQQDDVADRQKTDAPAPSSRAIGAQFWNSERHEFWPLF